MKEDLMFAHLGNGITVFDRNREVNGDYVKVAHINAMRMVHYYSHSLSEKARKAIRVYSIEANPNISASQEQPVFTSVGHPTMETISMRMSGYLMLHWDNGGTSEFDKSINDLSRDMIEAVKREKGSAWLLKINRYDDERKEPYLVEYKGQKIYNGIGV